VVNPELLKQVALKGQGLYWESLLMTAVDRALTKVEEKC